MKGESLAGKCRGVTFDVEGGGLYVTKATSKREFINMKRSLLVKSQQEYLLLLAKNCGPYFICLKFDSALGSNFYKFWTINVSTTFLLISMDIRLSESYPMPQE